MLVGARTQLKDTCIFYTGIAPASMAAIKDPGATLLYARGFSGQSEIATWMACKTKKLKSIWVSYTTIVPLAPTSPFDSHIVPPLSA